MARHFTKQEIEEIRRQLSTYGIRDTEFPKTSELNLEDYVPIIQEGKNKIIPADVFHNKLENGPRGYSAYEIAVQEGYTGTKEEWLADPVNGIKGNGVKSVTVVGTASSEDSAVNTYRITLYDETYFDLEVRNGKGIKSVAIVGEYSSAMDATNTYRITMSDDSTFDFDVKNATGITSITSSESTADSGTSTYTIHLSDNTEKVITVKNGKGIASVVQTTTSTEDGGMNVVTIMLSDGTTATFQVRNGKNSSGFFVTASDLSSAISSPAVGNYAFVSKAGDGTFPAYIYVCTIAGTWTATENEFTPDDPTDVLDVLDSTSTTAALSANQGKVLDGKITQLGQEKVDKKRGKNLFDKNAIGIVSGKYLTSSGNQTSNSNYNISEFIPVIANESYYISRNLDQSVTGSDSTYFHFYDSDFNIILPGIVATTKKITVPSGASYLRITYLASISSSVQVEKGNERTTYEPFSPIGGYEIRNIADEVVTTPKIADGVITTQKIADKSIITDKLADSSVKINNLDGIVVQSSNLYNKDDEECVTGKYVYKNTGELYSNESYKATGWIPVTEGAKYIGANTGQYAFYNLNKEFISNSGGTDLSTPVTAPANAAYLRFSIPNYTSTDTSAQLNKSDTLLPYEHYYSYKEIPGIIVDRITDDALDKSPLFDIVKSRLWNGRLEITAESLSNGNTISLTDYPKSLKQGDKLSLFAKITSWGDGITVGKGTTDYTAAYLDITATQVILKSYANGVETVKATENHGLTLETYIKIIVDISATQWTVILQTLQGTFHTLLNCTDNNGTARVKSNGAILTDITFSATNSYFQSPVWMFGDSYFGIATSNRELYWLKEWGYLNVLVEGFSGQTSSNAIADLNKCLAIGKPKYLVWCLGMNDNNSDFNVWLGHIGTVKSLCAKYGMDLIIGTVPQCLDTTSYKHKDDMSNWIRQTSGCRYIDVAKAVGSDENGHWYGYGEDYDYQSTDNVHPSVYGAKAIATQFLTDFPELMQY